jgi:Ala-tRNA(Pro) deacylase
MVTAHDRFTIKNAAGTDGGDRSFARVVVRDIPGDMSPEEQPVYARLDALGIRYARYEHPAIATAEAGHEHWAGIEAAHCKNLFMRNQKGTRHYLVIIDYRKRANLRAVSDQIGDGKLSFGSPERLREHLGVTPGSVSPFGLIYDADHSVRVAIDRDLRQAENISFHPNINTATVVLSVVDFQRFLQSCKNAVQYVSI